MTLVVALRLQDHQHQFQLLVLNEAPMAGDHFAVYEDEKAARAAGEERAKRALYETTSTNTPC